MNLAAVYVFFCSGIFSAGCAVCNHNATKADKKIGDIVLFISGIAMLASFFYLFIHAL